MAADMGRRCQDTAGRAGAEFDIKRVGRRAWAVEGRAAGPEPPLKLIFRGRRAYRDALRFCLGRSAPEAPGDGAEG